MELYLTYIILLVLLVFSKSMKAQLSSNLSADDLNIIASKINDIPETTLGVKLILITFECSEVRLFWNVQKTSNNRKKNDPNWLKIDQKILGYQVVIHEFLTPNIFIKERKPRILSSKYIDPSQNRFKLINMFREDEGHYLICLVIYVDVIETVAFEKQCLTLYLPKLSEPFNKACQTINPEQNRKNNTNKNINGKTNFFNLKQNFHHRITRENITNSTKQETNPQNSPTIIQNCEHITKCRHYNNILIVFVICGILLMSNIFMFTIIMIQNPFKKQILKENKMIPKTLEHSSAYQLTNKFRPDGTKLNDETFSVSELSSDSGNRVKKMNSQSSLSSRSCSLLIRSFFDSIFKNTSKNHSISKKKHLNQKDMCVMNSGYKIRPSYIISLPNESNKLKENFESSEKITKRKETRNKNLVSNSQINFQSTQNLDLRHFENYDNEIFYHLTKNGRHINSVR